MESAAVAIEFLGIKGTPEEVMKEWSDRAAVAYKGLPMKAGGYDYLQNLSTKGVKIAMATSAPKQLCEIALNTHNINKFFNAVCRSEEVGVGKNKPDVFLLAAKKIGVSPSDCIVYEDSIIAMKTAKATGMAVCAVYDESSSESWEEAKQIADYAIKDFKEEIPWK